MNKVPISLIIDDGGVVNTYSYHDLANYHEELVPPAMAMLCPLPSARPRVALLIA